MTAEYFETRSKIRRRERRAARTAKRRRHTNGPRVNVTFFPSQAAQSMRSESMTLPELCDRIQTTNKRSKAALPWLKLASFGEQRTDKNCLRHNANVLEITGVEADYDREQMTLDEAIAIAKKAKLSALFYTSASYTEETPRWRVLLPTSKPLPPTEHTKLVARVNGLYGGVFGNESFALSQSYYFGSVNHNPTHRAVITKGGCIDLRNDLDAVAIGKGNGKFDEGLHVSSGDKHADPDLIYAAMEVVPNDVVDWVKWNNVGMAIWLATQGADRGFEAFDMWSKKSAMYNVADNTKARWKHYFRSPPRDIGAGSIFMWANEAHPTWREEYEAGIFANLADKKQAPATEERPPTASPIIMLRAADVKMREKEWLWEGHLLRGALELMTGLPGMANRKCKFITWRA
jgi:Primase C terminal 2 (PriCT-2)